MSSTNVFEFLTSSLYWPTKSPPLCKVAKAALCLSYLGLLLPLAHCKELMYSTLLQIVVIAFNKQFSMMMVLMHCLVSFNFKQPGQMMGDCNLG